MVSSFFNTLIGRLNIQETPEFVRISGIPPWQIESAIHSIWNSSRVSENLIKLSRNEFAVHKFLLPDFLYVLQELLKQKYLKVSRRTIQELIDKLKTDTWLSRLDKDYDRIVDLSQLSKFHKKPLAHQAAYLEVYNDKVPRYGLRGHLLSAVPGAGKTMNSLYLMECLGMDTVIIISPKNALEDVWVKTLQNEFKITPNFWVSSRMKPLELGYKYYVAHYEQIDRFVEFFKDKGKHLGRVGVITDECLHPDTEVLTPTGFKKITEVTMEDKVLQFNKDGTNEWVNPSRIVTSITNEVHHYENRRWAQSVTPNHRMVYYKRSTNGFTIEEKLSNKLFLTKNVKIILSGKLKNNTGNNTLTDIERLLIAIQADGSVNYTGIREDIIKIDFALSKQRKKDRLLNIVSKLGYTYHDYTGESNRGYGNVKDKTRFIVRVPIKDIEFINGIRVNSRNIKLFKNWVNLEDKNQSWCKDFLDEIIHWDGHIPANNETKRNSECSATYYSTTVGSNADIVQLVGANAGVRVARIMQIDDRKPTYKDVHRIFITEGIDIANVNREDKYIECLDSPQRFYCLTVPSGMFFVRYKGKISVTGNCHNFNDIKSKRTQNLIHLVREVLNSEHTVLMSGTPIKAMALETVPIMKMLDPLFTPKAEDIYLKIFGKSTIRALDILSHRLGYMSFRVEKKEVMSVEIDRYTIQVPLKNGGDYTLDTIRSKMRKFVEERIKYYKDNERKYIDDYQLGLAYYEDWLSVHGTPVEKSDFATYKKYIQTIRRGYDAKLMKTESLFCNKFENDNIAPRIPQGPHRQAFRKAKSVYKYVNLTILGEALGSVLGKIRVQCNVDVALAIENVIREKNTTKEKVNVSTTDLINNASKKTIFFTSYVEVVKALQEKCIALGFKPLVVYGDTNKDLVNIVKEFDQNKDANPLIATFQSLSTAVPLVMANNVIMLNNPFRPHEYQQAEARAARIGQDSVVDVTDVFLDTKGVPNISTRSKDILDWAAENVAAMLGVKVDIEKTVTESIDSKKEVIEYADMDDVLDIIAIEGLECDITTTVESTTVDVQKKNKSYLSW